MVVNNSRVVLRVEHCFVVSTERCHHDVKSQNKSRQETHYWKPLGPLDIKAGGLFQNSSRRLWMTFPRSECIPNCRTQRHSALKTQKSIFLGSFQHIQTCTSCFIQGGLVVVCWEKRRINHETRHDSQLFPRTGHKCDSSQFHFHSHCLNKVCSETWSGGFF